MSGLVKVAVRRDNTVPAGQPAPMHIICPCQTTEAIHVDYPDGPDVECPSCGRRFSAAGWILRDAIQ